MEWFCAVWNSDKAGSAATGEYIYELLCQGDTSMVSDFVVVEEFYQELIMKAPETIAQKLPGAVIISCDFSRGEYINDLVQELAKKHGLSFYEPQNMTYIGVF